MDETQDDALVSGECWSGWYRVGHDRLPMDASLPMDAPAAIRYRWRWLDLGGTGPIPPAEPGTKLDPRPDVIGACVQLANLEE